MTRALRIAALAGSLLLLTACPQWGEPGHPDGCVSCHEGIEAAHAPYIDAGRCSTCHGGDASRTLKKRAHVLPPEDWAAIRGDALPPAPDGFIRDFAPDQLDATDPAYVRFINPGDIRVLDDTCGTCHPSHAATMPLSVMATNVGHYWPSLFLAGLQDDREAHFASFEPANLPEDCSVPGSVCEVEVIRPPDEDEAHALFDPADVVFEDLLEFAWRHYLSKNCNTCHQGGFPRNNSGGLYRSSGCTSCHMVYDEGGTYQGGDPTLPRGSPPHPKEHILTSAIPTEQCASCHFQGGRIGLMYRGIREGGFRGDAPPNAVAIQRTLYGHAPPYYYTDEDSTNDWDETPADVHADPDGDGVLDGMVCADCHVGSDVHGDGTMWSTSKLQVSIRCEDCHGTVRDGARPREDGLFYGSRRENPLRQLSFDADAERVFLTRRMDGATIEVPQVADILGGDEGSVRMHASMAPDENGWSHTDSLTCDTCHTPQLLYCIGCHVNLDMRIDQVDYQTGQTTPGLTRGSRKTFTLDHLLLGTAPDGKIQTVHPSQQVQMSVVGSDEFGGREDEVLLGEVQEDGSIAGEFREAHGFAANIGFMPFFQHTVQKEARHCEDCHRQDASDEELARVRGVYGYGTGEFVLDGPGGQQVDGLQFLDADGGAMTTWVHRGTGPVEPEARQRAIDVVLDSLR